MELPFSVSIYLIKYKRTAVHHRLDSCVRPCTEIDSPVMNYGRDGDVPSHVARMLSYIRNGLHFPHIHVFHAHEARNDAVAPPGFLVEGNSFMPCLVPQQSPQHVRVD
jgi:hypothetical protein